MKKRLFTAFLALTLTMGLGACGAGGNGDKNPGIGQNPGIEENEDENTGDSEDDGNSTDGAIDGSEDSADQDQTGGSGSGSSGNGSSGAQASKPQGSKPQTGGSSNSGSSNSGSQSQTQKPSISGSFEDIIKNIYSEVGYEVKTSFTEVTADNAEYYLGSGSIKFKKALASEPMMSSVAHSVVLLEAEEGADLAAIKKTIKENVDGRKWVCVGVEDEDILTGNVGNYIMLVMDEDSQSFMDVFLAMGK